MSKSTTTAHNVAPVPTITDEQELVILGALKAMYDIVREGAHGEKLPDFNACGVPEYGKVFVRAHEAVKVLREARKAERALKFRQKIQGVLDTHINARRKAISDFDAELSNMSPMMRQVVLASPAAPNREFVDVPLSDIVAVFAPGTPMDDVVRKLTAFGYTIPRKSQSVRIALTSATK